MTALVKLKVSIYFHRHSSGLQKHCRSVLQSTYHCKVLIMEALPEFKIFSNVYHEVFYVMLLAQFSLFTLG